MNWTGWKYLLADAGWCRGQGHFPIPAYSEFMPPPWVGVKPYDSPARRGCQPPEPASPPADDWGWPISEYEQALQLRPGLQWVAGHVLHDMVRLGSGQRPAHISRTKLADNPYWPAQLAARAGQLRHERYVLLLALALSRTQNDKGQVLWTLFGSSEQGPAHAFWKGFSTGPGRELPAEAVAAFFRGLLGGAYGLAESVASDPGRAGLRVLPIGGAADFPLWADEPLPSWCDELLWKEGTSLKRVRFLLTFRPFARLPAAVQQAYLEGDLHLLPFPGSLVFWGAPLYCGLQSELPFAVQIPLLQLLPRSYGLNGLRVAQSGWMYERLADDPERVYEPYRPNYRRTHRQQGLLRDQDPLARPDGGDHIAHVLFSTDPGQMGLYGKPMARNAQLWTRDHRLLLDGPNQDRVAIESARQLVEEGGQFGYRFWWPPMQVGPWQLFWHLPLVAFPGADPHLPTVLIDGPQGYLTAYRARDPDLRHTVELWPRLLGRQPHQAAVSLFDAEHKADTRNVRSLLEFHDLLGGPLPWSFAEALLEGPAKTAGVGEPGASAPGAGEPGASAPGAGEPGASAPGAGEPGASAPGVFAEPGSRTLERWLTDLPEHSADTERGQRLVRELQQCLEPAAHKPKTSSVAEPLTFGHTGQRRFELAYWKTISALAHGRFRNKANSDCVQDPPTQAALDHNWRDLDALGTYLMRHYSRAIARAGLASRESLRDDARRGRKPPEPTHLAQAWVGEHAFRWRTDFDFPWWGGWADNQTGKLYERNIIVGIPGRDHSQAVIMADHYDTAYMLDHFDPRYGGTGARLAAAGADDNHSATAALMLAAPIFLELSKAGRLACDIWLVHLTGEEFPSDCLGARHLCQALVEGHLCVVEARRKKRDLSGVRIKGVYVSDMIAHNNEKHPYVFQMAPGEGPGSAWLALQAHQANERWNAWATSANDRSPRKGLGPSRRVTKEKETPALARHALARGSAAALEPAQHTVQHRRADLLGRGRSGGAVHGGLRHQPFGLPRQPRYHGQH